MSPRLSIKNISKSFAVPVLQGVNLEIPAGQIHGLVGENGAGKSTLINIVCGLLKASAGTLLIDGEPYQANSSLQAMERGVSLASQELSLIDELSVAENISLRSLPTNKHLIDQKVLRKKADELLEVFALSALNTSQKVATLSLAQKQLIELCKALSEPSKLLILDEPTAALSQQQSDILHTHIRHLASQGISIIYVSHRLEDILEVCDQVSVLRDGKLVQTYAASNTSSGQLIEQMSGGVISADVLNNDTANDTTIQSPEPNRTPLLKVNKVITKSLPNPLSLEVYSHEVLGIAGLAGAGRTELLEAMFGLSEILSGEVLVHSSEQSEAPSIKDEAVSIKDSAHAVSLGLGMLSEDRKQQGIFSQQSLYFNAKSAALKRENSAFLNQNFISSSKQKRIFQTLFKGLSVKFDHLEQHIDDLSGGNQQKVLLARWLYAKTKVFLLDEPTRGVDSGAKLSIYKELEILKQGGAACVVVSSEIEELFTVCDRILVMSNAHIVGELKKDAFNKEKLLRLAFSKVNQGASANAQA